MSMRKWQEIQKVSWEINRNENKSWLTESGKDFSCGGDTS